MQPLPPFKKRRFTAKKGILKHWGEGKHCRTRIEAYVCIICPKNAERPGVFVKGECLKKKKKKKSYKCYSVLLHVAESALSLMNGWRCGGENFAERMWEGDQYGMMRVMGGGETLPKVFPPRK
ncbi:UNVERIFIED_CONTAM: hypothetical protein K2H54_070285 [Gekko kuhli]